MANLKARRDFWYFVLWPVVGFALLGLGITVHWSLAALIFPWAVFVQWQASQIRCHRCGHALGKRPGSTGFGVGSLVTPRKCGKCSADVTRSS